MKRYADMFSEFLSKAFGNFLCREFGIHGDLENIGIGFGGLYVDGHHLQTECRLWRCTRCGEELGYVTCPSLHNWGRVSVSPEFVKSVDRFRMFTEEERNAAQ